MAQETKELKTFISSIRDFIDRVEETNDLLADVWVEIGAYNNGLSEELNKRLRRHFRYNDSE